ncbi:hypothetical protein D3C85_1191280 [compost metagenome]
MAQTLDGAFDHAAGVIPVVVGALKAMLLETLMDTVKQFSCIDTIDLDHFRECKPGDFVLKLTAGAGIRTDQGAAELFFDPCDEFRVHVGLLEGWAPVVMKMH